MPFNTFLWCDDKPTRYLFLYSAESHNKLEAHLFKSDSKSKFRGKLKSYKYLIAKLLNDLAWRCQTREKKNLNGQE